MSYNSSNLYPLAALPNDSVTIVYDTSSSPISLTSGTSLYLIPGGTTSSGSLSPIYLKRGSYMLYGEMVIDASTDCDTYGISNYVTDLTGDVLGADNVFLFGSETDTLYQAVGLGLGKKATFRCNMLFHAPTDDYVNVSVETNYASGDGPLRLESFDFKLVKIA